MRIATVILVPLILSAQAHRTGKSSPVPATTDECAKLENQIEALKLQTQSLQLQVKLLQTNEMDARLAVDETGIVYARSTSGVLFPVSLINTEAIPGIGVRYSIQLVNIYSVPLTGVSIDVTPIQNSSLMDIPRYDLRKSATNPYDLQPGASCTIQVLLLNLPDGSAPTKVDVDVHETGIKFR